LLTFFAGFFSRMIPFSLEEEDEEDLRRRKRRPTTLVSKTQPSNNHSRFCILTAPHQESSKILQEPEQDEKQSKADPIILHTENIVVSENQARQGRGKPEEGRKPQRLHRTQIPHSILLSRLSPLACMFPSILFSHRVSILIHFRLA
jgi:hypothetical protein